MVGIILFIFSAGDLHKSNDPSWLTDTIILFTKLCSSFVPMPVSNISQRGGGGVGGGSGRAAQQTAELLAGRATQPWL